VVCYFGCQLKKVLSYDDALDAFDAFDAFGIHGIGGFIGVSLVGYFVVTPFVGSMEQVGKEAFGLAIAIPFAFIVSFALAFAIKATIGLRSSEEDEELGLDQAADGESGYNLSSVY